MMQELNYIRCGDYYIPDIRLPEENRPIGRWGRMHRDYIKEHNPIRFNDLCLSGELWTYLADLNEQAQNRLEIIIEQMKAAEGVTEDMKQHDQMAWVRAMNSVPFPVSWTVKMKKKQKETQDILSYHTQAAGCSDKARAKASGGRQPIEECGRTGL